MSGNRALGKHEEKACMVSSQGLSPWRQKTSFPGITVFCAPFDRSSAQIGESTPQISRCIAQIGECTPKIGECTPSISKCTPQISHCSGTILLCTPEIGDCIPAIRRCIASIGDCSPSIGDCSPPIKRCLGTTCCCLRTRSLSHPSNIIPPLRGSVARPAKVALAGRLPRGCCATQRATPRACPRRKAPASAGARGARSRSA